MCKRFKHCIKPKILLVLTMWKKITKRLLNVTLCELIWFITACSCFFMLWMNFYMYKLEQVKKVAQYPVILWWNMEFPVTSNIRHCPDNIKCYVYSKDDTQNFNVDAYMFYASNIDFKNLPLPRQSNKIIWALYHEESPRNVEELLHEKALSLFNFSSTFSRYSNIPFPLQHLISFNDITNTEYFVKTSSKNELLKEISPIIYLQSDCETSTERDAYVKELMKYIPVDSYGACLKNKELPQQFTEDYLNNLNEDKFLQFVARFKFAIAIENGVCNDYVTEKFWRAIKVGTVPIYFGSPLIRDWFPNNKSAILIEDYKTVKSLYQHVKELLENDTMYESYLEHKTKEIITNEKLIDEYRKRPYQLDSIKTIETFECFVCEKLHKKLEGEIINSVVNKSHYDCPKPISALNFESNPENSWIYSWENAEVNAQRIYNEILNRN